MLNDLEALEVFASLCTTGSIQKTAQALGIDSPTALRKLTKLETQLGRQLINREKRPFEMTADACAIIGSVKKILEERQQIETYYRRLQSDDSMLIRVMIGNAHINFATKFILEYAEQFPKLRFNMLSPSDVPSFLEGKADVICLSAQAQLSNCIMLPRGRMIFVPVATPQYLKEHGPINHPDDLLHHRVFSNLYPNSFSLNSNYQLTKKGQSCSFQAIDTIRYSNVEMTRRSVLEHAGIAPCMPLFFIIDDLEAGRLVPVLGGWHRPSHQNYVVCKDDDWKIRQIRMFSNWWAQKLGDYEKECEARLIKLYGRKFFLNLIH